MPSLLLVTHDQAVARSVERALETQESGTIVTVGSGAAALGRAAVELPAFALVDASLPGAPDGATTARCLRERFGVPTVLLGEGVEGPSRLALTGEVLRERLALAAREAALAPGPISQDWLERTERLRAIGLLAAGVVHRLNNPLAYLLGNLELAHRELPSLGAALESSALGPRLEALYELLTDAVEGARKTRDIVHDLGSVLETGDDTRQVVDPQVVLQATLNLCSTDLLHHARLERVMEGGPYALAFPSELALVALHLLRAVSALGEGARDRTLRLLTGEDPRGRLVLEVSAEGEPLLDARIPWSSRAIMEGPPRRDDPWMDLAACHRAVVALGGELTVERHLPRGNVFRVTLPPPPRPTPPAPPREPSPPARQVTRPRVLIVDDEPLVVLACERTLEATCEVTTTNTAAEALRRVAAGARFDAILCDLMMPEMSGSELHAALSLLAPDQAERMVFLTGGASSERGRTFLAKVRNPRLEKPADLEVLRATVLAAAARRD